MDQENFVVYGWRGKKLVPVYVGANKAEAEKRYEKEEERSYQMRRKPTLETEVDLMSKDTVYTIRIPLAYMESARFPRLRIALWLLGLSWQALRGR